jgi:hypothetical protein
VNDDDKPNQTTTPPAAPVSQQSPDPQMDQLRREQERLRAYLTHIRRPGRPSPDFVAAYSDAAHQADSRRVDLDRQRAHLARLNQFTALRGRWSAWLIFWISSLLAFHVVLTFAIGSGKLDFEKYSWFLPMVVAQNFLQIVGMGIVVVKFLYPGTEPALVESRPPDPSK